MVINPITIDKDKTSDIFSKALENGKIYLIGEVTEEMSASIIAQMHWLDSKGYKNIDLYINSPGGSVTAGLAIYDTMQSLSADVSTLCMGMAASMGAFILAGGSKGKRYTLPNAEVMIHQPLGGAKGQASDIRIMADHIDRTRRKLNEILAANTGKDIELIARDTDRDKWMSAAEALEYGLVDKIITKAAC